MKFESNFVGFSAIGDTVVFKSLYHPPIDVCTAPPDVDSHILAEALNTACNGVFKIAEIKTEFRF